MALTIKKRSIEGAGIRVTVNAGGIVSRIPGFIESLRHRGTIHRKIAIQLYGWVIRNFDSGGDQQTPPWLPLSASTLRQKIKLGYSRQPLLRTGNLRQSFAPFSDDNQAGVGARASFGVDYARVHQDGMGHVPKRDMLPPKDYVLKSAISIYGLEIARLRQVHDV